jgi:hypothetical protein
MQTEKFWSSFYNSNCFNNLKISYNLCTLVGQIKNFISSMHGATMKRTMKIVSVIFSEGQQLIFPLHDLLLDIPRHKHTVDLLAYRCGLLVSFVHVNNVMKASPLFYSVTMASSICMPV